MRNSSISQAMSGAQAQRRAQDYLDRASEQEREPDTDETVDSSSQENNASGNNENASVASPFALFASNAPIWVRSTASSSVQTQTIGLSAADKNALVDYLFEMALSTLGSLDVSNKPSLFLVYAHHNSAHGQAKAEISKYLIEKLSQTRVNLYSDQTPMGQPYSGAGTDRKEDGKLEDILTSQLCLLPVQLRSDVEPVNNVAVCCSEVLGSYLKWPHYEDFYQALHEAYLEDRETYLQQGDLKGISAVREVVEIFSQEEKYKAGFHHVLTEIAFLQIRAKYKKDHGIIPVALTPNSFQSCLGHFISATTVRMSDIARFEQEDQTLYPNRGRHAVLFKLIERLLVEDDKAQLFLSKFWQGYIDCIERLNDESNPLGPLEFAKQLNSIFGGIWGELHQKISSTAQQFCNPAWQQKFMQHLVETLSQEEQKRALQAVSQPLAILGENIKQFKQDYEKNLKDTGESNVLSMYVPVQGIKKGGQGEEVVDLETELERFFESEDTVFLLQGHAGTGKSTFNRHLALKKLQDYQQLSQTQNDPPLVFFIELRSIKEPNERVIEQFLQSQGFASEQVKALQTHSHQRCIFIFDGYDEIKEKNKNFYDLNKLWQWKNAKFVITSRPEYLDANYQVFFRPRGTSNRLREVWMAPFTSQQRLEYIQNYVYRNSPGWTIDQYEQEFNKLTTLKKELERPIVLHMLLQTLPEVREVDQSKSALTLSAIYEQYFQKWWGKWQVRLGSVVLSQNEEEAKQELSECVGGFIQQGFSYIENCAVELTKAGLLSAQDTPDFARRNQKLHEVFFTGGAKTRLLRFNAPFQMKQRQHYEFSHKSMQEYLVARAICPPNFEALEPHPNDALNQLSLIKEPPILDYLVEKVKEKAQFKAYLHAWIEASKEANAAVTVGAANAITILVRAGISFSRMDLREIRVPNADLSHGIFDYARFEGADLTKVKLCGSWLYGANMREANLKDVEFGEMPALEVGGKILAIAYSPNGQWLAVGVHNGGCKLYQVVQKENQQNIKLKYNLGSSFLGWVRPGNSVAFSPDSQWLALAEGALTLSLWSVKTGELRHKLTHCNAGGIKSVAFSPDGQWVVSAGSDETIKLWAVETGENKYVLEDHNNAINSVSASPDGKLLASGGSDKSVKLWKLGETEAILWKTLEKHDDEIAGVSFSPHGKWLASGSADGVIKLWELENTEVLLRQTFEDRPGLTSIVFSPNDSDNPMLDGQWLASSSDNSTIKLWDLRSQRSLLKRTFEGHKSLVSSISFSPDGRWLASGSWDKTVKLWAPNKEIQSQEKLERRSDKVRSISISPDGKWLASGSDDKTVKLWELRNTGAILRQTLEGHSGQVRSILISPDGRWLVSGSDDKTIKLWKLSNGEASSCQTLEGHEGHVLSLSISPDGEWLASASDDKTIKLWKLKNIQKTLHQTLAECNAQIKSVSISPDGEWLIAGDNDRAIRLWKLNEGGAIFHQAVKGHSNKTKIDLKWLDDKWVTEKFKINNDNVERMRQTFEIVNLDPVESVSISPDSSWLASGNHDNTVELWELNSNAGASWRRKLKGHNWPVTSMCFSQDSRWLVSGSLDGTVKLWSVNTGKCEATIRSFIRNIHSIALQGFAENSAKIIVSGSENLIRIILLERKEKKWKASLFWTSSQNELSVTNLVIKDALNLDLENKNLIAQRQRDSDAMVPMKSYISLLYWANFSMMGVIFFLKWIDSCMAFLQKSSNLIEDTQNSDLVTNTLSLELSTEEVSRISSESQNLPEGELN